MSEELVKVKVIYEVGGSSLQSDLILSRSDAEAIKNWFVSDVPAEWCEIKGRIDDIDANLFELLIRKETVKAITYLTVNSM